MHLSLSCQTDTHLHDNVQRELEWDPEFEASDLAAIVSEGVITLTGFVHSFAAKVAAERAVKRVQGVRGVVNDIQVAPLIERTDAEIARGALHAAALHRCASVDVQQVHVSVDGPVVTLSGQVSSLHEKQEAERAASAAPGITRIENRLVVEQARELRDALRRSTCSAGCAKKSAV